MRWISAKEASKAVNDYALFVQKKRARMDKKTSGGRSKKYICSCSHCGWFVRLIKVTKSDNWKISSMQLTHSQDCTGEPQPSARQLAELNTFRNEELGSSSKSKASDNEKSNDQTDFTAEGETLGVKIPVRLAYRAKKIIQENSLHASSTIQVLTSTGVMGLPGTTLSEKIAESYRLLPSVLQKFADRNPGSIVALKKDEKGRFKSAFILPVSIQAILPSLQKVFGLEIVPCGVAFSSRNSTAPRYNGHFIAFMGKDGNLDHRIIAFGLIPIPDTENVAWFFHSLLNHGLTIKDTAVFLAYQQQGALAALRREFPRAKPMHCVESFVQTIEQRVLGISQMNLQFVRKQIVQASVADTFEAFQAHVNAIAHNFPVVGTFLHSFDPSHWAVHANRNVRMYNWQSTGFLEYLRESIQIPGQAKKAPVASMYQGMGDDQHIKSMQLADFDRLPFEIIYHFLYNYLHKESRRKIRAASLSAIRSGSTTPQPSWSQSVVQLTPGAEALFRRELFESEHMNVRRSEVADVALISKQNSSTFRVNMIDGKCSCSSMHQLGIPCRHLIATARAFKGDKSILTDCDEIYTMAVYQASLESSEDPTSVVERMPSLSGLNRDASIYPAPIYGSADAFSGLAAPSSGGGMFKRNKRRGLEAAESGADDARRSYFTSMLTI
uniref:SWIM-type domain-containing protein n=1 Tax=Globisporangium ultimum (strain ATCC 200006 / CBS 805.95 / DAOM BR144) TaxID=431595 RepID=K3WG68_GLOUD